jgi:Fur family ferric uptake transcriptional regulator
MGILCTLGNEINPHPDTRKNVKSSVSVVFFISKGVPVKGLTSDNTLCQTYIEESIMALQDQELKRAGLKVTLPRIKILQILESSELHLSAEDIYQQLRDAEEEVGIATVYRVLAQFEGASLVIRHNFDNGPAVYEIDRGDHHDHMVCAVTGKVIEFHDVEIEKLQRKIAEKYGYQLVDHNLVLYVKPMPAEN